MDRLVAGFGKVRCLAPPGGVKPRNTLQACWCQRLKWRPMALMFDSPFKEPMNFSTAKQLSSTANAPTVYTWAMMLTVSAAAALFALSAQAQNAAASAPAPSQAASQPATAASAAETPPSAPRYSAPELERAFNFMDGNHDGKLSREEASGFRGVAKHFDQADTNKDNFLSPEEFDKAMNYVKPK